MLTREDVERWVQYSQDPAFDRSRQGRLARCTTEERETFLLAVVQAYAGLNEDR